jgi:hypothetical protein
VHDLVTVQSEDVRGLASREVEEKPFPGTEEAPLQARRIESGDSDAAEESPQLLCAKKEIEGARGSLRTGPQLGLEMDELAQEPPHPDGGEVADASAPRCDRRELCEEEVQDGEKAIPGEEESLSRRAYPTEITGLEARDMSSLQDGSGPLARGFPLRKGEMERTQSILRLGETPLIEEEPREPDPAVPPLVFAGRRIGEEHLEKDALGSPFPGGVLELEARESDGQTHQELVSLLWPGAEAVLAREHDLEVAHEGFPSFGRQPEVGLVGGERAPHLE